MIQRGVWFQLDGAGGAALGDIDSGHRWVCRADGTWRQTSPRLPGPSMQIARLMAHPDTQGRDVAEVLRGNPGAWPSLLRMGATLAHRELGVTPGRTRATIELVSAIMVVSERLEHQVVMVVDNPAALAVAYQVDAMLSVTHIEAVTMRYAVDTVDRVAGRTVASDQARREALFPKLLQLYGQRRPGQRYILEPVQEATR